MISRAVIITTALAALAVLAALHGVVTVAYQKGVHKGDLQRSEHAVDRERELNRALTSAVEQGASASTALSALQRQSVAQRRAWKETLDAKKDASLVDARPPACDAPDAAASSAAAGDLQLSADFRGLYDDAWCAAAGDSVSAAACRSAAAATAAGPVAPRAVLEHTEEQTAACAADRQRLDGLITLLSKPPWKAAPPTP